MVGGSLTARIVVADDARRGGGNDVIGAGKLLADGISGCEDRRVIGAGSSLMACIAVADEARRGGGNDFIIGAGSVLADGILVISLSGFIIDFGSIIDIGPPCLSDWSAAAEALVNDLSEPSLAFASFLNDDPRLRVCG